MPTVTIPYTFINGQVADGAHVSANFVSVKNAVEELAVTEPMIVDGAVTTNKIAIDAVETAKILNGAVTTDKILDGAITALKLSSSLVGISSISYVTNDTQNSNAVAVSTTITLASQKHVFILGKTWSNVTSGYGTVVLLQVGANQSADAAFSAGATSASLVYYGLLPAGTYTIAINNGMPTYVALANSRLFIVEFTS